MASGRNSSKNKFSRVVRFAQTEADQLVLQAIDQALQDQMFSSFEELCKRALEQFLLSPPSSTPDAPDTIDSSSLQNQLTTLQQQIQALQLQVARLEGALGMQQIMSWEKIEQQMIQVQQDMTDQLAQLNDRLSHLESGTGVPATDMPEPETSPNPEAVDPLLTRLVPLLEDF